jgi:predicted aspartyl protease
LNEDVPALAFTKPVDRPIDGLAGRPDGVAVNLDACAERAHLCVSVMLNGRGPFRFMLDSGAALNVITPQTAARLGLKGQGKLLVKGTSNTTSTGSLATIARTGLGTLNQFDQTFAVVDIGHPDVDGLLGYQWLRQAVLRIDWAGRKLTFYDPATYAYRGTAQPRPLAFHGNVPRIEARVDGHAGWFNLDTGDFAGVTVNPAFARATGLDTAYKTGEVTHYGGVGGTGQALLTQAKLLEFGGTQLQGPQLQLSRQTNDLLSAPGLAGNLGYGVLHRFDIVLDYPGRRVYFEPNAQTPCASACTGPALATAAAR